MISESTVHCEFRRTGCWNCGRLRKPSQSQAKAKPKLKPITRIFRINLFCFFFQDGGEISIQCRSRFKTINTETRDNPVKTERSCSFLVKHEVDQLSNERENTHTHTHTHTHTSAFTRTEIDTDTKFENGLDESVNQHLFDELFFVAGLRVNPSQV